MPDQSQTQRFIVQVQGIADLQRLEQAARDAQRALDSLKAAQAQVGSGTITPALLRAATGGATVGPADLGPAMASALKDAQQKQIQAAKDHADAQKAVTKQQEDHNKALDAYIQLASKSGNAADREWAAQQRKNAELQKGLALYTQLASAGAQVPQLGAGAAAPSRFSFLGSGISAAGARYLGIAGQAASGFAYAAGAATGIPGAGMAAGTAASSATALLDALPGPAKTALGLVAAAATAVLAQATAEAMERGMDLRLANAVALAPGQTQRQLTQSILGVGANFAVPFDENAANARALGVLGVGGGGRNGLPGDKLPLALNLAYAAASMSGMTNAQGVQMVGDLMTKQGMSVEAAAKALQNYRNAAEAAHVPLQRMFDIMQQMDQRNLPLGANVGQLASLQAQLGMGFNIPALLGPAMGATGLQAKAMEGMLGMTAAQFHRAQLNPATLFDTIAGRAKAAAGGDKDVLAGLLNIFGMDTSAMNPQQVQALAGLIQNGAPGAAQAYYQQYVRVGANAPTTGAAALIAHQAAVAGSAILPLDRAKTMVGYGALGVLVPTGAQPGSYPLPPGADPNRPGPAPTPTPTPGTPGARTPTPTPGKTSIRTAFTPAMLPPALRPYYSAYVAASAATGVPPAVLAAQDWAENAAGNPVVVNPSGATGLAQIKPSTAAMYGHFDLFNPKENIMAQAKYDADLYKNLGKNWGNVFPAYQMGLGGYRQNPLGADQADMARVATALEDLARSGLTKEVRVIVQDSAGRALPSTHVIKQAASATPTRPPGHSGGR